MSKREWDDKTLSVARGVYGALMGSLIIGALFFQIIPHLLEGGLDLTAWLGIITVLILGLAASMPWIFLAVLGDWLHAWRGGDDS